MKKFNSKKQAIEMLAAETGLSISYLTKLSYRGYHGKHVSIQSCYNGQDSYEYVVLFGVRVDDINSMYVIASVSCF